MEYSLYFEVIFLITCGEKTSPEVDAAFVNTIIGFMTVGVTVLATYLINRQTVKETAKMNNQTLNLVAKQLEIQEQQAMSTLRDYVFQQRVEFYLYLLDEIDKQEKYCFNLELFYLVDDSTREKHENELSEQVKNLKKELEPFFYSTKKKYVISSARQKRY